MMKALGLQRMSQVVGSGLSAIEADWLSSRFL